MELPGKYCIGLIEEDNPQKSYFRFMPLILAEQDGYRPVDMRDQLPENGCIRIVPDKNESSRFKARMRRVGRYCAVDLREHPEENDKIRPKKIITETKRKPTRSSSIPTWCGSCRKTCWRKFWKSPRRKTQRSWP